MARSLKWENILLYRPGVITLSIVLLFTNLAWEDRITLAENLILKEMTVWNGKHNA